MFRWGNPERHRESLGGQFRSEHRLPLSGSRRSSRCGKQGGAPGQCAFSYILQCRGGYSSILQETGGRQGLSFPGNGLPPQEEIIAQRPLRQSACEYTAR